jgi:hypothetical protein
VSELKLPTGNNVSNAGCVVAGTQREDWRKARFSSARHNISQTIMSQVVVFEASVHRTNVSFVSVYQIPFQFTAGESFRASTLPQACSSVCCLPVAPLLAFTFLLPWFDDLRL